MILLLVKELADLEQQLQSEILISLDQSTDITGYAIFINKELKKYGHTKFDGDYLNRIVQLRQWLAELLEKCKNFSVKVAIEEIQLQHITNSSEYQNVLTFKKLAQVQGVLLELLTSLNIDYEVVPSNRWKSVCEIKGKRRAEQKKSAQEYVKKTFGIAATQDESDAICIGQSLLLTASQELNWE